ncbi:MAG: SpoIIE family protein phosphatase [Leptospirales bacterium]|nr:SpoIIE family protein phosphatase [Leptospirales bacterium]
MARLVRRITLILLASPLLFLLSFCQPATPFQAQRGLVNLQDAASHSGPRSIGGQWEIYWDRLYTPADFDRPALQDQLQRERAYFHVPARWDLPGQAQQRFATLRLRWQGDFDREALLSLRWASNAVRLMCGASIDESSGAPGSSAASERPGYRPLLLPITEECRHRREIVLQISNFHSVYGGPTHPLLTGSAEQLWQLRAEQLVQDISVLGLALGLGIYHLMLWIFRRRDVGSLYFALLCLAFLTRVNDNAALLPTLFPGEAIFPIHARATYIGIYILTFAFVEFLRRLFPREFQRRVSIGVALLAGGFSLHALFASLLSASKALAFFLFPMAALLAYCALAIFVAVWRRRRGARLMSAGILLLCLAGINDILVQQLVYNGPRLAHAAFFIFLSLQSAIQAGRFARSLERSEHLGHHLEKEVEAQTQMLRDANRQLEELDLRRTAFFQSVSHELRTPLTLIHGPLESAHKRNEALPPDIAGMVLANSRRLLRLVNRLMDMQKIAAGQMQLDPQPLPISAFLEASLSAFSPYAQSRGINLDRELGEDLPVVLADPDKLDKCVYNYLSNALKFTPAGGRVVVRASAERGGVLVAVSDTGIGVSEDRQAELFRRFSHSEIGLLGQEGSGLGLAMVKELIEMHNGEVGLRSTRGAGSEFWFWLPAAPPNTTPLRRHFHEGRLRALVELSDVASGAEASVAAAPAEFRNQETVINLARNATILIVEDHPDLRNYLIHLLHREGYRTLTASGVQEALLLLRRESPDLLITDYMMGDQSGLDLVREVRRQDRTRSAPILMLTAWSEEGTRQEAAAAGVDAFLAKPFHDGELQSILRNLLSLKSAERAYLSETEHARRIQQSILPAFLPEVPGLTLAARYEPLQEIGGDFYDVTLHRDGSLSAYVADVAGHGVSAALVATMGQITLGSAADAAADPAQALSRANAYLNDRTAGNFLTCCFVRISSDRRSAAIASAGHPPSMLLRRGAVQLLQASGRALALTPDLRYQNLQVALTPGDRLFLYTDALYEARNPDGQLFGEERLQRLLAASTELAPSEFLDRLHGEILQFRRQDSMEDDFTAIVIDLTDE